MMNIYHTILAEGNGGAVKFCQKEAGVQSHELTNRNSIRDQDGALLPGRVAKVHVLIRGGLFDMQLTRTALQVATFVVIREESAEAIVACKKRRAKHELGEGTDELL